MNISLTIIQIAQIRNVCYYLHFLDIEVIKILTFKW